MKLTKEEFEQLLWENAPMELEDIEYIGVEATLKFFEDMKKILHEWD